MKKNFIVHYIKNYKAVFLLYTILAVFSIIFTICTVVSLADFLRLLFDTSSEESPAGDVQQLNIIVRLINVVYDWLISFGREKAIFLFSVLLLVLYFFKDFFGYFASYTIVSIRSKVMRDIRNDFYEKTLRLPVSFFSKSRKGDMLTRFSDDIIQFDEYILKSIQQLLISIASIVLYLTVLFYTNTMLTLFVLVCLPFSAFVISRISRKLRKSSTTLQQKTSFLMSLTEETLEGVKVIKAHNAISFSNDRFQKFNQSYTRLKNSIYRRIDLASPISDFLGNTIVIGILIFGSYLVLNHSVGFTSALFITYIVLFVLTINPSKDISTAISQIKKGQASIDRIEEILSFPEGSIEEKSAGTIHAFTDKIIFESVSFEYNPSVNNKPFVKTDECILSSEQGTPIEKTDKNEIREVLSEVCFEIKRGQTIAIVGPSGGGKSTLIDLLMRFYEPTKGRILMDGSPIRNYSLAAYRKLIGIVTQDTLLFNDTVFNNIAFGYTEASETEVVAAAKMANAHEFIMQLEDGYQAFIGDYGGKLSGGQRQRISIARSVLQNPPVLVLDEATSALDTESEYIVQEALKKATENRTTLVIAHRLSTIVHADQIIVLDKGKIVQQGVHQSLINENGLYKKLCSLQMLH